MSLIRARAGIDTVRTVADLRARIARWRAAGDRIALVPTMGALHGGHGSLLAAARAAADRVVASIYVNPTQFGPNEDFTGYPRDEAADRAFLAAAGVDLLYAPATPEMYPEGFSTLVKVGGHLTECLCGAFRPGHFDGVATVVAKLFAQAAPDVAFFGEKDYQQLCVIRRMARDLDFTVRVEGAETVREADGLATSSRNVYLTPEERAKAPVLYRAITRAAAAIAAGAPAAIACDQARSEILAAGFSSVDYVDCVDGGTLAPVETFDPGREPRIVVAARIGRARLIDNVPVKP